MCILKLSMPWVVARWPRPVKWMARRREFDEEVVLDAAVQCFWARGYESTSVKDLMKRTGLTAASLYNAYGDKRAMFGTALDRYIEKSIGTRIRRCEALPP